MEFTKERLALMKKARISGRPASLASKWESKRQVIQKIVDTGATVAELAKYFNLKEHAMHNVLRALDIYTAIQIYRAYRKANGLQCKRHPKQAVSKGRVTVSFSRSINQ